MSTEHDRLVLIWSTPPYKSFTKRLDYRLGLVWSTFPYIPLVEMFDYRLELV